MARRWCGGSAREDGASLKRNVRERAQSNEWETWKTNAR